MRRLRRSARLLSSGIVIAVVDRDGRALLVRAVDGTQPPPAPQEAVAVSKAGTAVFLSSNGEALTSRTAGFIIQQHYPPGVVNSPPGPLVGVGFSSMAFSDVNFLRELDGGRIPGTRLYGSPGGVPIYKGGMLVAGIGVTGAGPEVEDGNPLSPSVDETIALAGQVGFEPPATILASNIFVGGIRFAYVASTPGAFAAIGTPDASGLSVPAPVVWPTAILGGVLGEVRSPIRGDPETGTISGQERLTADEVRRILSNAAARILVTRAGIRLPAGQMAEVFISVVANPNQAGVAPPVLGTFRTPDATIFSWDVSVQKARTAVFSQATAGPSRHARWVSSLSRCTRRASRTSPPARSTACRSAFSADHFRNGHDRCQPAKRDHDLPGRISALQERNSDWRDRRFGGRHRPGRPRGCFGHGRLSARGGDPRRQFHLPGGAAPVRRFPACAHADPAGDAASIFGELILTGPIKRTGERIQLVRKVCGQKIRL